MSSCCSYIINSKKEKDDVCFLNLNKHCLNNNGIIVIEKNISQPDLILNKLRESIIKALNPKGSEETKDGMDCALCAIDIKNLQVDIASANNSVVLSVIYFHY